MGKDAFNFKQFSIQQDRCSMKVGTDSVLLGAWTEVNNEKNTLDIGSGTGILCLMMAQRLEGKITGVELDKDAYEQSIENVKNSPWENRISIFPYAFQFFVAKNSEKFDLIICNPPYFKNSLLPEEDQRKMARHTIELSFSDLANGVSQCLHPNGKFNIILPTTEALEFREICKTNNLFLTRICKVFTNQNQLKEKRHLMQFEFLNKEIKAEILTIEKNDRHQYTKEYQNLTKDFYLKF